jgi:aryl-alcohol dehydrogenase-like predicted oxidoreductase
MVFLPWAPISDAGHHTPLRQVADSHGASISQVALAWLLARSPMMLVIPGTGSLEHLEENVAAAGLVLAPHEVELLNRAGGA